MMKKLAINCLGSLLVLFLAQNTHAQDPEFWGMTLSGGDYQAGAIFKTDLDGTNQTLVHSFSKVDGRQPNYLRLCEATNGKMYGMTQLGGANDKGTLFEYDPSTNIYTKKWDFGGANDAAKPYGSLIQAANGKLYGLAQQGGTGNKGAIFEYDISTENYTRAADFDGNNGFLPRGSLVQASNGKLYGMALAGGLNDDGVIFDFDINTGIIVKTIDFEENTTGKSPKGSMMQASNGRLYGMTSLGGTNNDGVLFEYDPSDDSFTKRVDFEKANSGADPIGDLAETVSGKLFGMTASGGANDQGVLFEYDVNADTYTKQMDFDGTDTGSSPQGSLSLNSSGKLYGLTNGGGANNHGVLFEFDPSTNTYIKKIDFEQITSGMSPRGTLTLATNGKMYGATNSGGAGGADGVLFEYDPATDTFDKKLDFNISINGESPYGDLVEASNGKVYGLTYSGGAKNAGVLFEYDPDQDVYTKKFDFGGSLGANPRGSLMQASNGKLYGMTSMGGLFNTGVLFEYDLVNDSFKKKFDFDAINGKSPRGNLIEANNGILYGMAYVGGVYDHGVLFAYDTETNNYSKKVDFQLSSNGGDPHGSLMQASNGKLYGITHVGGIAGVGALFEFDPANDSFSKKADFLGDNGHNPRGHLIEAINGKLYGTTAIGGISGHGVLFEYDLAIESLNKKVEFDGVNGRTPQGSLLRSTNGKLYGTTTFGGGIDEGVLFEYDPADDSLIKKFDFDGANGQNPYHGLIATNTCSNSDVDVATTINGATITANATGATYQWLDCNNGNALISGATNKSFTPTENGSYAVLVTQNGCTNTSTCTSLIVTGIPKDPFGSNLSLYPNPTSGQVILDLGKKHLSLEVVIRNAIGQKISNLKYGTTDKVGIMINGDPGLYFVEAITDQGNKATLKVLKQ